MNLVKSTLLIFLLFNEILESFSKMLALNKDAQVKQRQPIIPF